MENVIGIHEFMIKELYLRGCELFVYAALYKNPSFTKQELVDITGYSETQVGRALNFLADKQFLFKKNHSNKTCTYEFNRRLAKNAKERAKFFKFFLKATSEQGTND